MAAAMLLGACSTDQRSTPDSADPTATFEFQLLPPGADLPSEESCSARIPLTAEQRPENRVANHTRGVVNPETPRVTGDYVGSTGQIIRWAACKWGLEEDLLRAQIWVESNWKQSAAGDRTMNVGHPENCGAGQVLGADGSCPESIGLTQVRTRYYPIYDRESPWRSTAYNVDVLGSELRSCFNGEIIHPQYLHDHGYVAGDIDGCMGYWFSGDWHVAGAEAYVRRVREAAEAREWTRL